MQNCYLVKICTADNLTHKNIVHTTTLNLTYWEFANLLIISEGSTWNFFESRKTMKKLFSERTSVLCTLYIELCIGMWIANKSVQFFWKLIWDNMNILRVKSIMNRDPSARMCNRIRVPRGQQIKLVHTVSKSKFGVFYSTLLTLLE